tara:strand:+ start:480 stop:749 length:270 start_codon:yes stop_codon:yes gene_type:complete
LISEERARHFAYLIIDGLWKDDLVDYSDDDKAMQTGKQAMEKFVAQMQAIDEAARQKVASLKRGVVEGSSEWDILYRKYFEEEMSRRGN